MFASKKPRKRLRGSHFSTHGGAVDLEIVVIIKGEIIPGEYHADEVTECASLMVLWEEVCRKHSQALIPSLCGILEQYIMMKQQV